MSMCFDLLKKAIPPGSTLLVCSEGSPDSLRDGMLKQLQEGSHGIFALIREPAFFISRETIKRMVEDLEANPDIWCLLPSDTRGYRGGKTAEYYTLRGLERFIETLSEPGHQCAAYDEREPWIFLVRTNIFSKLDVPEDPMQIPQHLPRERVCVSLNAYIHSFLSYYDEMRSDILPLVPEGINSLLDLGCSSGNFGAAVRNRLGCRVVGVEVNPDEARRARTKLDMVIEGDILSADISETFDCITCLDVLEHIDNTGAFLEKVRILLNDPGHLLLSIPNIGHWSIVEDLLAGRWDYVPAGILCTTHLRFFTKGSIEVALKEAGFTVVSIKENRTLLPENADTWVNLLQQSGLDVDRGSLSCLSYHITAQKTIPLPQKD
jgi:SAM-dependent methyltransferase